MWYVATHTLDNDGGIRGDSYCFGGITGRCGVWVTNTAANDTLAHEIGHLLTNFQALWQPDAAAPGHSLDANNLLASGGLRQVPGSTADVNPNGARYDQIQTAVDAGTGLIQADVMRASRFADSTPEPAPAALLGLGLAALAAGARRLKRAA